MFDSTKSNGFIHHTKQMNELRKHQAFSVLIVYFDMLEMNFYVCFSNTLTEFFNVILKVPAKCIRMSLLPYCKLYYFAQSHENQYSNSNGAVIRDACDDQT